VINKAMIDVNRFKLWKSPKNIQFLTIEGT
jgi:hypothetical protein